MKTLSVLNVALLVTMLQVVPTGSLQPTYSGQDAMAQSIRAAVGAFPVAEQRGPKRVRPESLGVVTNAPSVLLRDVESGVELTSRGADIERPIASITKLMTALVLLNDYEWDWQDEGTVLRSDVREGGRWYVRFGDEVDMDELFTIMLVASGNNETLALVREVGASEQEFVEKMNARARTLGMRSTQFADPVGLSPNNTSTARDVSILLDAAMARDEIASRVRLAQVEIVSDLGNTYTIESTDQLLGSFLNRHPYAVIGGKTGTLDEAGYCLTIRVERDGHLLDATVLGATEPAARFSDVKALIGWAVDVFTWEAL